MLLDSATREERRNKIHLLTEAASLLFGNGETTRRTVRMVRLLGRAVGLDAELLLAWGASTLHTSAAGDVPDYTVFGTEPLAVDMNKVAEAEHLICSLRPGADSSDVQAKLDGIARLPAATDLRFVAMSGVACLALGVIFGVNDPLTLSVIGLTAVASGILRRAIAHLTAYPLMQPLLAALLSGLCGAAAIHAGLSNAQWAAVVPCMILLPGPQVLNGALDLARGRAALGTSRLVYASVVVLMICIGLLCGLTLGRASLPVDITMHRAPFAFDVLAAGAAVAAFGSFFSMPWRTLGVPVAIGMLAHSVRWLVLLAAGNLELATFAACLTVGIFVTLLEDRLKMPFAAMAFSATVSMLPGYYLFQTASGVMFAINSIDGSRDKFLIDAILNGTSALIIFITIAFGLIGSKMVIDHFRTEPR